MITVASFIKTKSGFVSIDDWNGPIDDEFYINGAILCRVNNADVITIEHWDLVDQLWAYIVDGLHMVIEGKEYDTCFPDQPLRLRFIPVSANTLQVEVGDCVHNVNLREFVREMARGSIDFFRNMERLCPSHPDTWNRYIASATKLQRFVTE